MLKDIASSLGLSVRSVKSYLFRAVRKLQKELGGAAAISGMDKLVRYGRYCRLMQKKS